MKRKKALLLSSAFLLCRKEQNMKSITISKEYYYCYVSQLPKQIQNSVLITIEAALSSTLLTETEKQTAINKAANERLCNLTDTINIQFI